MPKGRPSLHQEHSKYTKEAWREEVASQGTQLGYWEWVYHRLEEDDIFRPTRQLPDMVAERYNPYDMYDVALHVRYNSDLIRFAIAVYGMRNLSDREIELVAQNCCSRPEDVRKTIELASDVMGKMVCSLQEDGAI